MSSGYIPTWNSDPYRRVREMLVGDDIELYQTSAVFKAWVDAMAQTLEVQRQTMVMTCEENEHLRKVAINCISSHPHPTVIEPLEDRHE